jgi:RNA polymerase sigma factor for flagellar operon FliA
VTDAQRHEVDSLWERYKLDPTRQLRDQLIVQYSPLVKYVAGRVAVGLPQSVDQADLVSYGVFGLIDAIEKFEPARGFRFETYAISRIKGAIMDELRSIDWVPRSVRAKARQIEQAMAKLEAVHHRSPTDEELADELDMTVDRLQSALGQISFVGMAALDELLSVGSERGESMTLGDTIADDDDGPLAVFESVELRERLRDAVLKLPERERKVLGLYYYEGLTLAQIGEIVGVTESRICQIHTRAVLQLRGRLAAGDRERPFAAAKVARSA